MAREREKIFISHLGIISTNLCNVSRAYTTASQVLKNMNPDVEPCDDFYKFACGGFLDTTIIPDDKTSVSSFSTIDDDLSEQLRGIIEKENPPNESRAFKLARDFYKACMNKSKQHKGRNFFM